MTKQKTNKKQKLSSNSTTPASNIASTSTAPVMGTLQIEDIDMTTTSNLMIEDTERPNADINSNIDAQAALVQYDMAISAEATTRAAEEIMPPATKRAYGEKIKKFTEWATATPVHEDKADRPIVTGEKLNYFMKTQVVGRLSRKGKAPKTVTSSTIDQCIAAITFLYRTQVKRKINAHEHPRLLVKDLLAVEKAKDYQTKRDNFEDRGVGTLADGYTTMDQVANVVKFFMDQDRNHGANLRAAGAFLFSHYFLLRSQSVLQAELTDIQTVKLENEAISPDIECPALVMVMRKGKTNKNNRLELEGCMRSRKVEVCPVMALGFYLFWRFHMENEAFPNFTRSKDWYPTKLFKSNDSDPSSQWNYNSHRDAISRGLDGAKIISKSKTHVGRGCSARMMADLAGVNEDQTRRLGRWNSTTMNGTYLTGLPREAMRVMAGLTIQPGQLFLSRAALNPSEDLLKLVFPDLDQWNDRLLAKHNDTNNGDPMEVTVAAKACFDLFFTLRKSILQDAVEMMDKFPNHPLWANEIFANPLFLDYKERVKAVIAQNKDPAHILLQRCVAVIEFKLKTLHNDLSIRLNQQAENQDLLNDYITRLVNGQASINLTVNLPSLHQTVRATSIPSATPATTTNLATTSAATSTATTATVAVASATTPVPTYLMSRGIVSLGDLRREWSVGLCGGPAVLDLERKYGTKWRQNAAVKKFFLRRNAVVDVIVDYAKKNHIDVKTAVAIAEKKRVANNCSIH